jgi:hypothetical protein
MRWGRARWFRSGIAVALGAIFSCFVACSDPTDPCEPAPKTTSLVDDVCRRMCQAPCGSRAAEQQCLELLRRDRDDATSQGCEAELNAYLQCGNTNPVECSSSESGPPKPNIDCFGTYRVLDTCITGVSEFCGLGIEHPPSGVSCTIHCLRFVSKCTGPSEAGPLQCECSTGPKAGTTFQARDCWRGHLIVAGHTCR